MENLVNTELITNYMRDNKLSKKAFCELCKISVGTLNKILNNVHLRVTPYLKIARLLNVRMSELLVN